MTTDSSHSHEAPAGPDPDAVELLERVVDTSLREQLPSDLALALLHWTRFALVRLTTERVSWGEAFGLEGSPGQGDGFTIVRRRIRDRRLAEAGELVCPGASAAEHARELARLMGKYGEMHLLAVESADLPAVRLLRQAESFAAIPTSEARLAEAIRHGYRLRETESWRR